MTLSIRTLSLASPLATLAAPLVALACSGPALAQEKATENDLPKETREERWARAKKEMKPYTARIPGTEIDVRMVPIPGGVYLMGSPENEEDRQDDEGPQRTIVIEPFWMAATETSWDQYDQWSASLEKIRRKDEPSELDVKADAVSRPTPPYTDMTFGMGQEGFPAICMTQKAALTYCEWLGTKLEQKITLPTEAQWEYACRAGTTTAYWFGDDPDEIDEYEWVGEGADFVSQKVGTKKPNPWGLYDMHGNVAEWCLDQYAPYAKAEGEVVMPYIKPTKEYPRVARGGSYDDDPEDARSASRKASEPDWKMQDPQIPQSVWYHTDARFLGFRVIRPWDPRASQKKG